MSTKNSPTAVLRIDISALITKCQVALIGSTPVPIAYHDKVSLKNNELPPSIDQDAINIYALWVRAEKEPEWVLMYIGQRSAKNGWNRVRQHLFWTPNGTQSKLAQVQAVVKEGSEVGVTAIRVEPDSMRLAVEEELINLNSKSPTDLPWNEKARSHAGKKVRT